jgi:hypothetical protein
MEDSMPKLDRVLSRLHVVQTVPLLLAVAAVGCTATVTTNPPPPPADTCSMANVGCVSGSQGWTCTGPGAQPEDYQQGIVCSTDGSDNYCCANSSCSYDATITTCVTGAVGYSCAAGAAAPDQNDPTLVCSVPTSTGADTYCCYTSTTTYPTSATCKQDPTITGCMPDGAGNPAYGFSCSGSDAPTDDWSGLNCSAPTMDPSTGANDFCCSYQ